jgi:uncharacterized membrane protein
MALRCPGLTARSLWFDEAFSWRLIEFPWSETLTRVAGDNHPPFYFLLLKAWAAVFGTSAVALRGLSVLLAGATVAGAYAFTLEALHPAAGDERLAARRRETALLVAALVAVNVFQIRWSWEVRMYSLGTALAAFSSWALLRALRDPPSAVRFWLLYAALALLFAYTHYYALFTLAAQGLFLAGCLLVRERGRPRAVLHSPLLWHGLLAASLVAVGWLPWLPYFLAQREQVRAAFWALPVRGRDLAEACCRMFLDPENGQFGETEMTVVPVLCVAALLAVLWRARAGAWLTFLAAAAPVAATYGLSRAGVQVFSARYLLFAQLFLLVGAGLVIARFRSPIARGLLWGWVFANSLAAYLNFCHDLDVYERPGARAAAARIDGRRRPGEPVVVCSPLFYLSILYHSADRGGWLVYNRSKEFLHYEGAAVISEEERALPDDLPGLAKFGRVWVVNMQGGRWGRKVVPVPPGWAEQSRERFREPYDVQGEVVVIEYKVSDASQKR